MLEWQKERPKGCMAAVQKKKSDTQIADEPVVRGERGAIIVTEHEFQWPPYDPQAGYDAEDFHAVVLSASCHGVVIPAVKRAM